ncbi:hypothetical protein ACN28S_52720 [Cystobacter fuscus]
MKVLAGFDSGSGGGGGGAVGCAAAVVGAAVACWGVAWDWIGR